MEPLLIGDVYVNVECSCGNTTSPFNLCNGSHWSCKWKKIVHYDNQIQSVCILVGLALAIALSGYLYFLVAKVILEVCKSFLWSFAKSLANSFTPPVWVF